MLGQTQDPISVEVPLGVLQARLLLVSHLYDVGRSFRAGE